MLAIEIAWGWVRFQPRSQLTLWYQERFGGGSSRLRRIGIVALAEPAGAGMARLTGRVARSVFVGDYVETVIQGAGGELTVEAPSGATPPSDGLEVAVVWKLADMRFFAREAA